MQLNQQQFYNRLSETNRLVANVLTACKWLSGLDECDETGVFATLAHSLDTAYYALSTLEHDFREATEVKEYYEMDCSEQINYRQDNGVEYTKENRKRVL